MSAETPVCVWRARTTLGEGPVWSVREKRLYWVDILQRALLIYDPQSGEKRRVEVNVELGSVAERARGGLVAGVRKGFAFLDAETGALEHIVELEADRPDNRFNDGKCDARGRFWAGTMPFGADKPTGALYRLSADLKAERVDDGYFVANGPTWSLDGRTMYHTDSGKREIYAFDFDPVAGEASNKRIFVTIPEADGVPDGMTTDAEGCIWLAHWGGARVTCFTPDGKVDRVIRVPAEHVTSCAFGGEDLMDLYITTATEPLSEAEKVATPDAGGLFRVRPGVGGVPAKLFAG